MQWRGISSGNCVLVVDCSIKTWSSFMEEWRGKRLPLPWSSKCGLDLSIWATLWSIKKECVGLLCMYK